MFDVEVKNKKCIVTRFTSQPSHFNKNSNVANSGLFFCAKNKREGEISVFDITEKILKDNDEEIFKFGDKVVCKKPPYTLARADLKTEDIFKIKSKFGQIKLYRNILRNDNHRNIRPYPNDDDEALHIANHLVRISKLHIRNKNS